MLGPASFPQRLARVFLRKKPLDPRLVQLREFAASVDQDRDLAHCDFTVLDTELTGLDRRKDEIVSIGAVRIRGLRVQPGETFHAIVRPDIPLPKLSTLIHRITPSDVAEAPPMA